jgi:hypothetical protein
MPSALGDRLKSHWLAQGRTIKPYVTTERIRAFEASRGVLLPADLCEYLLVVNGTGRYTGLYDDMFCFWSLEEFTPLSAEHPDAVCFEERMAYFLFADHSINLPAYAIRLSSNPTTSNPVVAVYSDGGEYSSYCVVDTFTEFVEAYFLKGFVL